MGHAARGYRGSLTCSSLDLNPNLRVGIAPRGQQMRQQMPWLRALHRGAWCTVATRSRGGSLLTFAAACPRQPAPKTNGHAHCAPFPPFAYTIQLLNSHNLDDFIGTSFVVGKF